MSAPYSDAEVFLFRRMELGLAVELMRHRGRHRCGAANGVIAELVGIDEVRHLPAVEIVFGHALFGEALKVLRRSSRHRAEQDVTPDLLGRAAVIDLVEF